MRASHPLLLPVLALILALWAGCGYSLGYQQSRHPGIRSIAIQVVTNQSYRQRLEIPLTRQLHEALNTYSQYRHAPTSRADAVLTVEILEVGNSLLVAGATAPVNEGALDLVARVQLVEKRTGNVLVNTTRRDLAEYRTLLLEDQSSAQDELAADLARKIVLALESDF